MVKNRIIPQQIIDEYASELKKKIGVLRIILFGSAARGKMTKDSDIDLIVISRSFKGMGFIKRLQLLSRSRLSSARKVPMDILGYTPEEATELSQSSSMLREALEQGKLVWSAKTNKTISK